MIKFNKPNYVMLQRMLVDYHKVVNSSDNMDQMPFGLICPGYDVSLMQPLAVLKYILGVETQWSCQGNHQDKVVPAYILIAPDNHFPSDLKKVIETNGFELCLVLDYDKKGSPTGKQRQRIRSNLNDNQKPSLKLRNQKFIKILNNWAVSHINEHLSIMSKEKYYKKVVELYS